MKATNSCGFRLRGSENWVFFPPDAVIAVRGANSIHGNAYTIIYTIGEKEWEVVGTPEHIASILWPLPEDAN